MHNISSERGVGLVEVLVAVLLLSVAVLGFSALQLRAVSATDESLVRTQAMSIIRGLSEDMRSNPRQLNTYQKAINDYDAAKPPSKGCNSLENTCSSEEIAKKQAELAAYQLNDYGIKVKITNCPGTANFSQIKCVIAAWDETSPEIGEDTETKKTCADSEGVYKSGRSCVIVEAY